MAQLTAGGIRVGLKISIPKNGDEAGPKTLRVTRLVPMRMKRRGVELRIVLDGKEDLPRKADPALLKAVARARRWFEEIAAGRVRSSAEIARREGLQKGYVARLTRLAFLSPRIVETVVNGRTPVELNLQMLMTTRVALPLGWREQKELLRNLGSGATY
jgi:site-specific DNA recombinase